MLRERQVDRRGITLAETLVGAAAVGILSCIAVTVPAALGGGADSQWKLAELGEAHACYANDFNGRQWGVMPQDAGAYGDTCILYRNANGCPDIWLGKDSGNAIWGIGLGCNSFGSCGNWISYRPMNFDATNGELARTGSFRLLNIWGFREYVSRNFYSPEWFAEDDPNYAGASTEFASVAEFRYPVNAIEDGYAYTSYALSPAAMLNAGVLRARADGGFQDPASFADSYRSPAVAQCTHPSLKSRMTEYGWFRNAPVDGLVFSAGRKSAPYTLFFDGSVQSVSMAQAEGDDLIVRLASKSGDGLWSDDTPYGVGGWRPGGSFDGLATGFHMLTTDGILGRDLLARE
ncbi:MAG: hypothetical protein ACO3QC_02815 [Phycisphaerales bacterium]